MSPPSYAACDNALSRETSWDVLPGRALRRRSTAAHNPVEHPMNPQSLLVVLNIVLLLFAIQGVVSNPRLSKVAKVAWVAFIVIAPFVGSLAYLALGRRGGSGGGGGGGTVVRGTERPTGWFFER
ncbi:PLD nuclease N-terminal domain-containing protein [Rathayibacter tritici]|nr:PLD nuclease N-terminal domain-containing protein [Rathayibacter tritici]